jgi:hypothetical protein
MLLRRAWPAARHYSAHPLLFMRWVMGSRSRRPQCGVKFPGAAGPPILGLHLAREFEKLREGFMPSLVIINLWTSKLFQFRLDLYLVDRGPFDRYRSDAMPHPFAAYNSDRPRNSA